MLRLNDPVEYFATILAVFLVLPIHEWAHAYTAYLLGDKTAKWEGRMSINPMRHLTLIGSISLFLCGFGWAKPVPINPYNLKKIQDPKVGFAICAMAGPIANFIMAILLTIVYKIIYLYFGYNFFYMVVYYLAIINVSLMVINLLPIPPLDGSRIWSLFLKDETYNKLLINEQKIILVVFVLIITGVLNVPLNFLTSLVFKFVDMLTWFIK